MMRKVNSSSLCLALLLSFLFYSQHSWGNSRTSLDGKPSAPQLTIAVASNFHFPLSTLIAQSDYWSAQSIRLVLGSSGTLHAQLSQGAPFDLFFSADIQRPFTLEEDNLAVARQTYAQGKLVLFPTSDLLAQSLLLNNTLKITGKLAIANPKLAPFGSAAQAYVSTLSNAQFLQQQMVLGANVNQAFQFVDSGNAEVGLLAESVLINAQFTFKNSKYSRYLVLPNELYPAIIQQVVIANTSKHKAHAQRFIDFVVSAGSQAKLASLGYLPISDLSQ
ncbi:MAG: molybdenum ABC transporter molybdate-binding protein [Alphaproteobacteria bacterium]|jgi:molybdenum ABC transporter molybdate-binding protein